MTISNSAMLVELNISVWTASKTDKTATAQVTSDNNADSKAAKVSKNLLAGTAKRKEIADFTAQCRLWHAARTLPWSDKGARLLPITLFLDYKAEANKRQQQFNAMVDEFIAEYPALVGVAQQHMGSLFDVNDYPDANTVRDKFGFRMVFTPLPESGDFRLDLPAQEMEEIKQQYDSSYGERVNDAMRNAWDQLHGMLEGMVAKLHDPADGDEKQKRYHDTFLTNATALCGMLTHLNVTGDEKLEQARRDLERVMSGVDMSDIRGSSFVRDDVKAKLDKILKDYSW
jgi:hypothetical protein